MEPALPGAAACVYAGRPSRRGIDPRLRCWCRIGCRHAGRAASYVG